MAWKLRRKRRLTMDCIEELVQRVANNDPRTTEVVLKGLAIQPELLTALSMALISNTNVKTLYLASLNIYSQSAQILASALVQNTVIETVWLEDNQITSSGASSFATALYVNRAIKTFGLRNNLIGNEGALRILRAMQANTTVQSIILDGNGIEWRLLAQINALVDRNMQNYSTKNKTLFNLTKSTSINYAMQQQKADIVIQKKPRSSPQEASGCDHDNSIASWTTLETIMEESESDDE